MACLGITGAMRIAPTAAMEVLLGLPPLHLKNGGRGQDRKLQTALQRTMETSIWVSDMHT
jgi:hypothetical protein